jgi:hypothetical protein
MLSTILAGGSVWLEFGLTLSGESPPVELQTWRTLLRIKKKVEKVSRVLGR